MKKILLSGIITIALIMVLTSLTQAQTKKVTNNFIFNEHWEYSPDKSTYKEYKTIKFYVAVDFYGWEKSEYQIFSPKLPKKSKHKIYFGYIPNLEAPKTQQELINLGESMLAEKSSTKETVDEEKYGSEIEIPMFKISKSSNYLVLKKQNINKINIEISDKGINYEAKAKSHCLCPISTPSGITIDEPLIIVITNKKNEWEAIIYTHQSTWIKSKY